MNRSEGQLRRESGYIEQKMLNVELLGRMKWGIPQKWFLNIVKEDTELVWEKRMLGIGQEQEEFPGSTEN